MTDTASVRRIDPTEWPRATTYRHYRSMGSPHLGITADIDVTGLVQTCKQQKTSVFAAMMHVLIAAANTVPQLRQRIRVEYNGEVVVEHASVDPAFTVPVEGGLFNFATVPYCDDREAFAESVARVSESQRHNRELQPFEEVRDNLIYMSCLPWMHFTSMVHPVHTDGPDSVPRIAWGRYTKIGERTVIPVNIQVHHAVVDGSHLGAFFSALSDVR
jgi:chloramphenicol O-acetyltransferase type A